MSREAPDDLDNGMPEFDLALALRAAVALEQVLEQRTHQKKVFGQVYTVPGQLAKVLGVPKLIAQLTSRQAPRRQRGLEAFSVLWATLSLDTRQRVLESIGWYDPNELDWEDKRSNVRPKLCD